MLTVGARDFATWREVARRLLLAGVAPEQVHWRDERQAQVQGLFGELVKTALPMPNGATVATVPAGFMPLAESAAYHRDDEVWALLYGMLWRLTHGEKELLRDALDPQVRRVELMRQQVGRDIHKMHAFVRFKKVVLDGCDTYLAFHRPDHFIVKPASGFFMKRFKVQRWGIVTPEASVCWDGKVLEFGEGMPASAAPSEDMVEDLWLTYYRNIFNPARIKTKMMKREMPVRHWATLPETAAIAEMLAEAPERVEKMLRDATAAPSVGALRRRERRGREGERP